MLKALDQIVADVLVKRKISFNEETSNGEKKRKRREVMIKRDVITCLCP